MSERERWIIYPLLFLALGAALRDKLLKTTASERIQCETLWVVDSSGRTVAMLGGRNMPGGAQAPDHLVVKHIKASSIDADYVNVSETATLRNLAVQQLAAVKNLAAEQIVGVNLWQQVGESLAPLIRMRTPSENAPQPQPPAPPANKPIEPTTPSEPVPPAERTNP